MINGTLFANRLGGCKAYVSAHLRVKGNPPKICLYLKTGHEAQNGSLLSVKWQVFKSDKLYPVSDNICLSVKVRHYVDTTRKLELSLAYLGAA